MKSVLSLVLKYKSQGSSNEVRRRQFKKNKRWIFIQQVTAGRKHGTLGRGRIHSRKDGNTQERNPLRVIK